MGIQIICTFNTPTNNIDKALLGKGRLIAAYEFKELETTKSEILLESLGMKNYIADGNMTLADIYNVKEMANEFSSNNKIQIGFKRETSPLVYKCKEY